MSLINRSHTMTTFTNSFTEPGFLWVRLFIHLASLSLSLSLSPSPSLSLFLSLSLSLSLYLSLSFSLPTTNLSFFPSSFSRPAIITSFFHWKCSNFLHVMFTTSSSRLVPVIFTSFSFVVPPSPKPALQQSE